MRWIFTIHFSLINLDKIYIAYKIADMLMYLTKETKIEPIWQKVTKTESALQCKLSSVPVLTVSWVFVLCFLDFWSGFNQNFMREIFQGYLKEKRQSRSLRLSERVGHWDSCSTIIDVIQLNWFLIWFQYFPQPPLLVFRTTNSWFTTFPVFLWKNSKNA